MRPTRAFTIVELLVVVSVTGVLVALLLPAIGKARDRAATLTSQSNLRQLGTAHESYAANWNGRHLTLVDENWGRYGHDSLSAGEVYLQVTGLSAYRLCLEIGWAGCPDEQPFMVTTVNDNGWLLEPMHFDDASHGFGWFRIYNGAPFSEFIGGFDDKVHWAPKDCILTTAREEAGCLEDPGDVCLHDWCEGRTYFLPIWSSYCLSPAALYSPEVFRRADLGGWQDPYELQSGFKVPPLSLAGFPDLKTHMLEHHWLQNARSDCNPAFEPSGATDCEPYYFNHSWESVPATLFYDGHVDMLGAREAEAADQRVLAESGVGLWSRDAPGFGTDGYFSELGYDLINTSFHILTSEGIRGRDKMAK